MPLLLPVLLILQPVSGKNASGVRSMVLCFHQQFFPRFNLWVASYCCQFRLLQYAAAYVAASLSGESVQFAMGNACNWLAVCVEVAGRWWVSINVLTVVIYLIG